MGFSSINPFNSECFSETPVWAEAELEAALAQVAAATPVWAATPVAERCQHVRRIAGVIRVRKAELAATISREMGKLLREAEAEVEKCAAVCEFYADHGEAFLADEIIASDASRSLVAHQPLGTVLAVMPWNYPMWQVMRFLAPALVAGNTGVLKHASNVPLCALALESLVQEAGLPEGVFRSLMIRASQVKAVIEDPRIHAVTLTGSEGAGRQVAATAGACLKKTVLELGGSDPFIVLEDADLDWSVQQAVASRFMNAGQTCIAAKRFIVVDAIADAFVAAFKQAVEALQAGDQFAAATSLAPMARTDLRDELQQQVSTSLEQGAVAVTGCTPLEGGGAFYAASILDQVQHGNLAYHDELFGPVAIVIRARDEQDAIRIANDSPFGLGGSVWTQDSERGEAVARQVQSGAVFVNGLVKSDPRLPFGGIKNSGYGRELGRHGMMEFVNQKTLWIK